MFDGLPLGLKIPERCECRFGIHIIIKCSLKVEFEYLRNSVYYGLRNNSHHALCSCFGYQKTHGLRKGKLKNALDLNTNVYVQKKSISMI